MTSDLDDLEEIAEQNDHHGNTRDHRGRKRGRFAPNHLVSTEEGRVKRLLSRRRRKLKPITLSTKLGETK